MKKGELTKQMILEAAKKEFYEKGYLNARMNQITKTLNIQPSWITYYFKTKENLAAELFREMFDKINAVIEASDIQIYDVLHVHFVRIRLLYRILLRDENTRLFFYELNKKKVMSVIMKPMVDEMYREIIKKYHITVTGEEFCMIREIDAAGRMTFFEKYLEGQYSLSLDDAVTILEGVVPRLLGMDAGTIDSMLLSSMRIANAMPVEDLHLLL